jgi:hypothetical protein
MRSFLAIALLAASFSIATPVLQAYSAEAKTVTVNNGTAGQSPLATRFFLDAGTTPAPLGTTVWFVADKNGDGVPTSPAAGAILGSDDEIVYRDVVDGDQPGSTPGRYRRLDIVVPDALRTAAIYVYLWNGTGVDFAPVNGSTFGLYRIGVVLPPDVGNAPWLVATNVNASQYRVGGAAENRPPVIADIPAQFATNGVPFSFTVLASDPDAGQTVAFSLEPGAPAGAAIGSATGLFTWTPGAAQLGTNILAVRATDNGNPARSATLQFSVVVRAPLPPPAPVLGVALLGGTLRITFTGANGATYQLQSRSDLTVGEWQDVGSAALGNGGALSLEVVAGTDPRKFFRVVAL